jgi:ABC-2 type transport system permease protein
VLLIARRELGAYFRSWMGPLIIAAALLIDGLWFYYRGLSEKQLSAAVLQHFIEGASGVTMIAGLVLAMRLVAEERQSGSLTLLTTSPLRDYELVLGKFLAAFVMMAAITALTAYMPALIFVNGKVSVGHILVGYLGLLLLGSTAIAIGLFGSALGRTQIVALVVGALVLVPLVLLWGLARAVDPPLNTVLSRLAIHHENFRPFMQGILQLDRVAYYLAMTGFFLLAATKVLEARRWR